MIFTSALSSLCTGKHHVISACQMSLLPVSDLISLSPSLSLFLVIKWKDKRCRRDKTRWRLHGNGAGENHRAPSSHLIYVTSMHTFNIFTLFILTAFQKIEVTNKSVFELITKTTEYLQPNPGMIQKSDRFTALCTYDCI